MDPESRASKINKDRNSIIESKSMLLSKNRKSKIVNPKFFTLGVFTYTEEAFFECITSNRIILFLDLRQRRGMRGREYPFVNSRRLQERLEALGVAYRHLPELAPPPDVRLLQKDADRREGVTNKKRKKLSQQFIKAYNQQVLKQFDVEPFIDSIRACGAHRVVLFCVEERPEACHRSLVAAKLAEHGYNITHL